MYQVLSIPDTVLGTKVALKNMDKSSPRANSFL